MNNLNEQRARVVTEQFFKLRPEDTTPTTNFDVSPEYTLIARLPDAIKNSIYGIVSELKKRFPQHYYYSPDQYHLTMVPIARNMDPVQIIEAVTPIIRGWRLPICARGIVANRLQAGVVLYPEEETLAPQRVNLRTALDIPEQSYRVHNLIWEELLWSNFMRFTTKSEEELLAFLRTHVNQDLGSFVVSKYELYEVSTKTLDPESSKLLYTLSA